MVTTAAMTVVLFLSAPMVAEAQYVNPSTAGANVSGSTATQGATTSGTGSTLPVTGARIGTMVLIAIVLLAVGTWLVLHNRKAHAGSTD
jgi:hypothetical protein